MQVILGFVVGGFLEALYKSTVRLRAENFSLCYLLRLL